MALVDIIPILQNPVVLAAILAVIYNIAGYIAASLQVKALEPYQIQKLGETLAIYEGLFIALQGVAGIPPIYVAILAIIVSIIRSLKSTIAKTTTTTPTPASSAPATAPAPPAPAA